MRDMTYPARTIYIFGLYLLVNGLLLLTVPAILVNGLGLPTNFDGPWIYLLGFALCVLGVYYLGAARVHFRPFFIWTVPVRIIQFAVVGYFSTIVYPDYAVLLVFAAIELASGIWTWAALRSEKSTA